MGHPSGTRANTGLPSGAEFHENIAAGWSEGYSGGGFAKRLACFQSLLKGVVKPGQVWLDLGCGSGVLTHELINLGATVVAVDGSPEMLKQARAFVGTVNGKQPAFIQGDVQALPALGPGLFDGVLCSSVIEYVEDPSALMGEVFRLLRPGGALIVSLPPRFAAVRTVQKILRELGRPFGLNKYTYLSVSKFELAPHQAADWLNAAGFSLDQVTSFDPVLPRALASILRPSLLVLEAHRQSAAR